MDVFKILILRIHNSNYIVWQSAMMMQTIHMNFLKIPYFF